MSTYGILLDYPIFQGPPGWPKRSCGAGLSGGQWPCLNVEANDQSDVLGDSQCPQISGPPSESAWLKNINAKLAAAGAAQVAACTAAGCDPEGAWVNPDGTPGSGSICGSSPACQTPTLAQLFAAAGIGQQDITCFLSVTPCYDPLVETYMASMGIALPSSTVPATNYVAPTPNATTASTVGNQVISAVTGQPVTPAAAPPPASSIVSSTAGASSGAATPVSQPASCSLALFGDTSCIGGVIGTTTALVIGGGLLALFFLFGGKR
jgi:hypothetical protein